MNVDALLRLFKVDSKKDASDKLGVPNRPGRGSQRKEGQNQQVPGSKHFKLKSLPWARATQSTVIRGAI